MERVTVDQRALQRRYPVEYSTARLTALRGFYTAWQARLREVDFDKLGPEGKVDYLLLANRLSEQLALEGRAAARYAEMQSLLPFAGTIMELFESRRAMLTVNAEASSRQVSRIADQAARALRTIDSAPKPTKIVAFRAAQEVLDLRQTLKSWYDFYTGYDPLFTWWAKAPHERAADQLQRYARALREKVVGVREGEDEPIIGDPIGRAALIEDLGYEMIPYGPEDLVKVAQREFAWCEAEMLKASRAMGFGDDWKAAIEKVKNFHVEPGKQTDLVRDLAREAVEFIERRNLVTVPPLAKDDWWIEMMSPERQKVAPFFLGGANIIVAYPTDAMSDEDKLMSMRGNNIHFSRATVQHELIPGHHLQYFMTDRYSTHRDTFGTPFWGEGWALYWEMLLWDQNFPRSPEDRVGMLFWRMHRAARIIFSLNFHLGTMTPQQAIDFLVDRVGHERANATAEVRRSFNGTYPPLYQIAYMMGGLQFRALRAELVQSGRMTDKAFHDAIMQGGSMPVEMVRARLTNARLTRDYAPNWKFAGALP
ncbi:MAG: DUF885 domain-containing protein [Gemmatimonadales bacterium]|nr:DUF885 domain-containing protein [Gemmatimonadales bacterium]